MSKVETYIEEHTYDGSSDIIGWDRDGLPIYQPWLTPDDAIEVAKIAREEAVDEVCEWLNLNLEMLLKVLNVEYNIEDETDIKDFIEDLKNAML